MKKIVITVVILLALVIVGANCCYVVEENQYACTFRFSEIVNTEKLFCFFCKWVRFIHIGYNTTTS